MSRIYSQSESPRVGVIGLGLIGGSIAKRLGAKEVTGVLDNNLVTCQSAEAEGFRVYSSVAELAENVDLIFVATPMPEMKSVFDQIGNAGDSGRLVVSDVGSVKSPTRSLVRSRRRTWAYVGGHPMAGTEFSGFAAASTDLLRGARWVLCLEEETNLSAFLTVADVISRAIGARVIPLQAKHHDSAVARISHLPYVVSAALSQIVASSSSPELLYQLAAGSFRDGTRVAGTPPMLSKEMCYQNRKALTSVLRKYVELLEHLSDDLDSDSNSDSDKAILEFFQTGFAGRMSYLDSSAEANLHSVDLSEDEHTVRSSIIEVGQRGGMITRLVMTKNEELLEFSLPRRQT
jgi:prephenate dehydrogenase